MSTATQTNTAAQERRRGSDAVALIEPRPSGVVESLREVWHYRGLVRFFGKRFLEKRYVRTWLGWVWLPLRPVATVASRALVFGGVIGISTGSVPYAVFFVVGQGAWTFFADVAYWSTRSLELSRGTLSRVHVPRLIPLLASAAPSFVEYLIYVLMAIVISLWYLVSDGSFPLAVGWRTSYAVLGLALLCALGMGIGLLTSDASSRARDIRFSLTYLLSFWYFFTPVIYPFEALPAQYRTLASLNPATAPIELVKVGLLGEGHLTMTAFVITVATIAVLWGVGLIYFLFREAAAADVA
jgi:lipopolysaccharide transport system permease protein